MSRRARTMARERRAAQRAGTRSRYGRTENQRAQEHPALRGIPIQVDGRTVQGVVLPSGRRYAVDSTGAWIRVEEDTAK